MDVGRVRGVVGVRRWFKYHSSPWWYSLALRHGGEPWWFAWALADWDAYAQGIGEDAFAHPDTFEADRVPPPGVFGLACARWTAQVELGYNFAAWKVAYDAQERVTAWNADTIDGDLDDGLFDPLRG